ncbi:unnamed protein product [Rhizophagus irregularis]|nr:unnamed protein product [Rhizophagus irregularis]
MEEQNFELKALMEYNSAEEFFDSDSKGTSNKSNKSCEVSESETSETLGSGTNSSEITIYVSKTFQSWKYVEKFMQRYASVKGHGVRIGGGGRVDKETCQILKRTYLCQHADESKASTFCKHVGHKLSPLASQFVPTLQKLSEEILQEIRFLTVVAKFRREAMPGEEDTGTLLKRLYDKKDEDPRWAITMKLDLAIARNSLTEGQFYERWDTLSQNYPESKDYLNRSLGQNPQS